MGVLNHLKPASVFHYFEDICKIPHGSYHTELISDYLVKFAREHQLKYRRDDGGNVVIWKDGSKGYEESEPVIIQGHIDMVTVKEEDCDKNLETDGLDLELNGDFVTAKGTSLGGDDGIAVAYALALLSDNTITHPPIEVVLTNDEEVGMLGAAALDASDLKGRLFINIDSEDEGIFTVSCAGGVSVRSSLPVEYNIQRGNELEIVLKGLAGGHSGIEIDKGRGNANVLLGRILYEAYREEPFFIMELNGGEKDNAIPSSAYSRVITEQPEKLEELLERSFNNIKKEYMTTDPNMKLSIKTAAPAEEDAIDQKGTEALLTFLIQAPCGIQRMNPEMKELVQTSLNLGIMKNTDKNIDFLFSVRGSIESEKEYLVKKLESLTGLFDGACILKGNYPGWEYRSDSRLRECAISVFKDQYGKEPVVEGIHAGLECGLFASKLENLDAISIGPQINNVHSVKEELSISSVERTWELLLGILAALK